MILIMAYMERRQTANVEQGALETQRSSVEEHWETLSTRLTNVSSLSETSNKYEGNTTLKSCTFNIRAFETFDSYHEIVKITAR